MKIPSHHQPVGIYSKVDANDSHILAPRSQIVYRILLSKNVLRFITDVVIPS